MANPATGFNTTISFNTGFFSFIRNVSNSVTREPIDTSHSQTTDNAMTFIPSDLVDYGEMEVELIYDTDQNVPIDEAAESVVVTLGNGTTLSFSGFLTNFGREIPYDDLMTATATLKVSGVITIAGGGGSS